MEDKPVRVGREAYPDLIYPKADFPPPPVPLMEYQQEQNLHLRDYWNVISARRWTIAAVLLTSLTVTMIVTLRMTPIYSAEATIQIDRENPNILSFKDVYQIETETDDTLQTQYQVLRSRALAHRVIENLKLDKISEFEPEKPSIITLMGRSLRAYLPGPQSKIDSAEQSDPLRPFVDAYLLRLSVTPIPRTRLVKVAFESQNPTLAARIINEHAQEFIEQNLQFKFEATTQASDFLSDQIKGLQATLEKSEDKLQDYSRQNRILFTDDGKNTAMEKLRQLEEEYTKVQADRIEKEALVHQIVDGRADSLPQLLGNVLISQLSVQAADLRRQEANLAVTFGPDYPSRLRIRSQIDGIEKDIKREKNSIAETVKAEFGAASEREKLLGTELEQQRTVVNDINQDIIQYNILKREVESNKQLYDGLLTRLKEAGVSAGLRASNIRIVDRADIPSKPARPQKILNLFLSFLGGLVSGIGLAFLQEYVDTSLNSPDEIMQTLGLPTLAVIPKLASVSGKRGSLYGQPYNQGYGYESKPDLPIASDDLKQLEGGVEKRRRQRIDLIIHTSPTSLMAEAYRSLRTSLLLSAPNHPPKTILITSSLPSEGKTATVLNLAVSLTQSGRRTLLIDGDMRKPRLHSALQLGNVPGLSSFLTGAAKLQDVIHESAIPNLFAIPCGAIPPNPGELILSERFRQMIQAVTEYFDYIIVDSPPLSHVSDARILANSCEASILVIKAASTSRHGAVKAVDQLNESHADLVGIVLNDVDVRSRKSGDYYSGYSTGYGTYGGYSYGQQKKF
jgi:capsular exopolysaccharide synthesis family protein